MFSILLLHYGIMLVSILDVHLGTNYGFSILLFSLALSDHELVSLSKCSLQMTCICHFFYFFFCVLPKVSFVNPEWIYFHFSLKVLVYFPSSSRYRRLDLNKENFLHLRHRHRLPCLEKVLTQAHLGAISSFGGYWYIWKISVH